MMLGIDADTNVVYEGRSKRGRALWPVPFLSQAAFVPGTSARFAMPENRLSNVEMMLFREDSFDPVSRVRRGRFYKGGQTQPERWLLTPHPDANSAHVVEGHLNTFYPHSVRKEMETCKGQQVIVLLGATEGFTIWSVANVEITVVKEELVSLRARQSFGVLPSIRDDQIPEVARGRVLDVLTKLTEDINRAGPESIIDRAREAATGILSMYLQNQGRIEPGADLGRLITQYDNEPRNTRFHNVVNAADMVRVFHARGKNAEQERRLIRPIREQDAELAVQCIGVILCDIGWAAW